MRRNILLCLYLGVFSCLNAFSEDGNVLLRINDDKTSVEEFEHYYAQAYPVTKISEERFLTHFLYFKLKVADAKRQGWDTLPDFRLQCRALQEKALKSMGKGQEKKMFRPDRWVKFRQISIPLPQHASSLQERQARQTMDSIYAALQQGASFDRLSQLYAADAKVSPYQSEDWIPEVCLVKEFTEQLNHLQIGTYTSPFFSPLGIHILQLEGREQGTVPSGVTGLDFMKSQSGFDLDFWNLPDSVRMRLDQVADGLLATYWDIRHAASDHAVISKMDLQAYFEAHRKDYAWDLPHFKGGVVHCKNKKIASRLKKLLKKLPMENWKDALSIWAKENPEFSAIIETGLFQIGVNAYVDKLAFKCGHYTPRMDYPYSFVLGKRLKKGPEDFTDVRESVLRDYRLQMEKTHLAELSQKFKIEINQDILKTVNCSGKK